MHVETCYFIDGRHFGPEGCCHTRVEDELGPVMPLGWTVQSESRNKAYLNKESLQEG